MAWMPLTLKTLILESININDNIDHNKLDLIQKCLFVIENKLLFNFATPRELDVCRNMIRQYPGFIDTIQIENPYLLDLKVRIGRIVSQLASSLKTTLKTTFVQFPKLPDENKPIIKFALLCNFDSRDHNGAIGSRIPFLIDEKTAFIASKSLICGSDLKSDSQGKEKEWQKAILGCLAEWQIYIKGELVVFLPANYPYSVEQLGFDLPKQNRDEIVKQIFEGPRRGVKIEDYCGLFKKNAVVGKMMVLHGHGNKSVIGGLKEENYRYLLKFHEVSGGLSLDVESCYLASNKLSHYISNKIYNPITAKFNVERLYPTFPIFTRSIGAFPTRRSFHSVCYTDYFNSLTEFLKGSWTFANAKKAMIKVLDGKKAPPFLFENLMQVRFPSQRDALMGFRPIGEDNMSAIINFVSVQAAKISRSNCIELKNIKHLDLLPLHISCALKIGYATDGKRSKYVLVEEKKSQQMQLESAPLIFSMIPGNSFHLIDEIHAENWDLLEFFAANSVAYEKCQEKKQFYIETLITKKRKYSKVLLDFSQKPFNLFYSIGENTVFKHFTFNNANELSFVKVLSPSEYGFMIECALHRHETRSDAIRTCSSGQENLLQVKEHIREVFTKHDGALDYEKYRNYLVKRQPHTLLNGLEPLHHAILELAVFKNDSALLKILMKLGKCDLNGITFFGEPMINHVIKHTNIELLQEFISHGAKINVYSLPDLNTPLHIAVDKNDHQMIRMLLARYQDINFMSVNEEGWSVFKCEDVGVFKSLLEAFKRQLKEGGLLPVDLTILSVLNRVAKKGGTLLNYAVRRRNFAMIEELLRQGVNPYVGSISAMGTAIDKQDVQMIKFLIDMKVDVTKVKSNGRSDLEEVCAQGTTEMLSLILSRINIPLIQNNPQYLQAAQNAGHLANADLLKEKGFIG